MLHFELSINKKNEGNFLKHITRKLFVHSVLVVCVYIFSVLFIWYTLQTYKTQTWY